MARLVSSPRFRNNAIKEPYMKPSWTLAVPLVLFAGTISAAPLFIAYDNFNYSGSVTRYGTLADARAGTNALSTTEISTATNDTRQTLPNARDGNLYVAKSSPGYDPADLSYFSTAWYFTTFPANGNGWGNPNNTNTGFVQYYDESAAPVVSGGWSNGNTQFSVQIQGGDGDSFNVGRLWAAPSTGGPSSDTAGKFIEFSLSMTADFAMAATLNGGTGWYEMDADPLAMTGSATGIFENDSVNSSLNGFYAFDFSFAKGSWAANNGATWTAGTASYGPENFFAAPSSAVPLPGTLSLGLLGMMLAGLATRRRR
jgi:hypothetical protein